MKPAAARRDTLRCVCPPEEPSRRLTLQGVAPAAPRSSSRARVSEYGLAAGTADEELHGFWSSESVKTRRAGR